MSYMEFQPTFEEKVKRETYLENILTCATDLILKDKLADSGILDDLRQKGSASHNNTCSHCRRNFILDKQQIVMFRCGHNFHKMCIKEESKGQTKGKSKQQQPIEITIRDLADAFAITEENAGVE